MFLIESLCDGLGRCDELGMWSLGDVGIYWGFTKGCYPVASWEMKDPVF